MREHSYTPPSGTVDLIEFVVEQLSCSKTHAKRLIDQGTIRCNGEVLQAGEQTFHAVDVIRLGKHERVTIEISPMKFVSWEDEQAHYIRCLR